ncbi:type-2 ice-structuring protein-like [Channa argus]|uniref:type-2 ice-structuring protein-like n=1 Tax=Channa argus TaxID=215402 RepID=UPI003522A4C3
MKTLILFVLLCATVTLTTATRPFLFLYFPSSKSRLFRRSLPCPPAWTLRDGRCFHYVPARLTWAKAEKNCQSMGANLASVHNADEYHDIQKLIAKVTHGFGRTWLGGSDCQKEGIWLWSDGTPFNYRHCGTFDNRWWRQHCLQMNYGANKCWDDVQCYHKLPSVCAKKP